MTRALVPILLGVALAGAACTKRQPAGDDGAALAAAAAKVDDHVTAAELAGWVGARQCKPVDANGDGTRSHMGVIPGAILLSDYRTYDLGELPADRSTRLVFYCANEECGASHTAAARAVIAGYQDVRLFKGGIAGWKNAGNATTPM
jgi:rhodanese-related sulfurtransferase